MNPEGAKLVEEARAMAAASTQSFPAPYAVRKMLTRLADALTAPLAVGGTSVEDVAKLIDPELFALDAGDNYEIETTAADYERAKVLKIAAKLLALIRSERG